MKLFPILKGILTLSIFLLLSQTTFAQLNENFNQHKINFYTGSENIGSKLRIRPRIFGDPAQPSTGEVKPAIETPKPEKKAVSTFELERQAFDLLNQRRIENGLQPVIWSDEVAKVARIHSQNMANNNFYSHQGLDGLMVDKRADALGLKN